MVGIPEKASDSVRLAAVERRLTACKATVKVLRCGRHELAAAQIAREIVLLEREREVLLQRQEQQRATA